MIRSVRRQMYALLATAGTLFTLAGVLAGTSVFAAATPPDTSGIGLAAGTGQQHNWVVTDAGLYAKAAKSSKWDRTPGGMVFHSCDYGSLPNGSHVDTINNKITLPDGTVKPIKPCDYPRVEQPGASKANSLPNTISSAPPAGANGWFQGFADYSVNPYTELVTNIAVPSGPQTPNTQSNFAWSGFSNDFVLSGGGYTAGNTIAQGVIGWGPLGTGRPISTNPTANGSGPWLWEAAYYYWAGNAVAGTVQTVNAADTVSLVVQALSCSNTGVCHNWWIDTYDTNNSHESNITITTGAVFSSLIGGMYEKANLAGCNQTFGNGHIAWRQGAYYIWGGPSHVYQPYSPSFTQDDVDQECGMNTINYSSGTGGDITWTP